MVRQQNRQSWRWRPIARVGVGLFLPILAACGSDPVREVGDFEPYVKEFEASSLRFGGEPVEVDHLRIQFGSLARPGEVAICEIQGDSTPTITVDAEAWEQSDALDREATLFHEMGHCVLRRTHRTGLDEGSGLPESLMHPFGVDPAAYGERRDFYLAELYASRDEI